jgi:hypothetical protein
MLDSKQDKSQANVDDDSKGNLFKDDDIPY